MALQEDDQLWEHLQGKSREELLGLLEQIMKKQPEIKGLLTHSFTSNRTRESDFPLFSPCRTQVPKSFAVAARVRIC